MNRNTFFLAGVAAAVAIIAVVFVLRKDPPPTSVKGVPSAGVVETSTGNVPTDLHRPVAIDPAAVEPVASGAPLDMATVALEAKMISNAQQLLAEGKPRDALKQIEDYERVPDRAALVPQARFVKIEALAEVGGRRTDALALAMKARDDPKMAEYQSRIDTVLADAGLIGPTPAPMDKQGL